MCSFKKYETLASNVSHVLKTTGKIFQNLKHLTNCLYAKTNLLFLKKEKTLLGS
jgi:hypothetical protein